MNDDLQRIKAALRRGAIDRNAKTALALGLAMSGAIISLPALAVTTAGTMTALYAAKLCKKQSERKENTLRIIDENDF